MTQHTDTIPDIPIFFEDDHLLLVNKPPGILSQEDHTGDPDILSLCKQYLTDKANGGGGYLGLVHRLDRPVGGLMLLAKTRKAADQLGEQLRNRTIQKTYHAIVQGSPPSNGMLTHHLFKNRDKNIVTVTSSKNTQGQEAILSFQKIDQHNDLGLLAIHLQTGRPHQIRVQLAEEGYPVWGDYKYGRQQPDGRTMTLRATELTFKHPEHEEEIHFALPFPGYEPWNYFDL